VADHPDAVVGDAVEEKDPVAVGMIGVDDPARRRMPSGARTLKS